MTEQAYPVLTKIEDLFQQLVWDRLVDMALAAMFTAAPGLAVWPLGPNIRQIVGMFSSKLFDGFKLIVDVSAIRFVNADHEREFNRAGVTLQIIARNKGINSDEFRKAKALAHEALAKFSRYGAAPAPK